MRNVIHTDGNYQVELTGKGKFLVRNRAGNELGQFQTNDAALQKIADDREYWENRVEQGNKRHKDRDVFFDANPICYRINWRGKIGAITTIALSSAWPNTWPHMNEI